jgi:hypothetical protein
VNTRRPGSIEAAYRPCSPSGDYGKHVFKEFTGSRTPSAVAIASLLCEAAENQNFRNKTGDSDGLA